MTPLGPCPIPFYPVDAWDTWKLTKMQRYELWRLVGPTVERHQERFPLWMVFVAVYLEGLAHGFHGGELLQREKDEAEFIDFQI